MAKVRPIVCRIKGCPRERRPLTTKAALGSHRRKVHGIASIALSIRRPDGGTLFCKFADCKEASKPYRTQGGLGAHLLKQHGIISDSPGTTKKRAYRAQKRASHKPPAAPKPAPPSSRAVSTYRGRAKQLNPGQIEKLRLRLLYFINGAWAREFDADPSLLRDTIESLCAENFPAPKLLTLRVAAITAFATSGN